MIIGLEFDKETKDNYTTNKIPRTKTPDFFANRDLKI
jgi:hypothetical protein